MPKVLDNEEIFQSVIRTVAQLGYTGSTTKTLAKNAGMSEVSLFRKFGSKQRLVKEAIYHILSESSLLEAATYTGDVRADLLRMISRYQQTVNERGDFITAVMLEGARDHELQELFDGPMGLFQKFAEVIVRYQQKGVLVKEHPFHAVGSLISPVIFTTILSRMRNEVPIIDLEHHLDRYLEGRVKVQQE